MENLIKLREQSNLLSLLYVEDDEETRLQFINILEILFPDITVAVDGQDAIDKYRQRDFDIVITDITMPKMNGIELMKQIREINIDQRILIVSAHDNTDYFLEAIRLNVDSFILKPIDSQQFYKAIAKSIEIIRGQELTKQYKKNLEEQVATKTRELAKFLVTSELTNIRNRKSMYIEIEKNSYDVCMLMDIDHFEHINITYGYEVGDMLLKALAAYLEEQIDEKNVKLFYIGTDEFAFLFINSDVESVKKFARDVGEKVNNHDFIIDNFTLNISVSFAINIGSDYFLRNTHIAMNDAKLKGSLEHIAVYSSDSPTQDYQNKIKNYLPIIKEALHNNTIVPYFQGITDIQNGKIYKYEALARIVDSKGTIHQPATFIDAANSTDMIPNITRIMIDKAFAIFEDNEYHVGINISEHDLRENYLIEYFLTKLSQYNIDPSRVVLEVLEGVSSYGMENEIEQLKKLKEIGFMIAIDDFGAENSNFERVHAMQVDFIKIDGKFIRDIDTNNISYNISKTITQFAHSIGAKVIAEHVHSKSVLDIVKELGIEYAQGYYFSQPSEKLL